MYLKSYMILYIHIYIYIYIYIYKIKKKKITPKEIFEVTLSRKK